MTTELETKEISALQEMLESKEISSRELTEFYLTRISAQSDLNAFTSVWEEESRKQADEADKRRAAGESHPLLGIPLAIKDLLVSKHGTTTCGSRMLKEYQSPFDASVLTRLRKSGAVILGKTNMDEFAMGSSNEHSAFSPVKNPWKKTHVPGGSSGGSAAAVAAGLCAAALGTDTGGSIRQPAAFCGITGVKPSYGRVSRYGLVAFASSLDQIGPMTRSAKDSAILLEAIAGPCSQDSTCADLAVPRYCETLSLGIQGKVIGLPKEYFGPGTHPEVSAALDQAIQAFEKLGATVKEVSLPHTDAAVAAYYIIAPAEASSNLARFDGVRYGFRAEGENLKDMYENTRSQGFGAEVKRRILIGTYVLSSGHFDAYYVQAQKVRNLILQDFVQAFEQEACDLLLGPVSPTPPFALGEKTSDPLSMYLNDIFTIPVNLAGLPAASIPGGFTQDGLPIGLHLIAPRFQEVKLFQFAQAFQEQSDWHTRSPF